MHTLPPRPVCVPAPPTVLQTAGSIRRENELNIRARPYNIIILIPTRLNANRLLSWPRRDTDRYSHSGEKDEPRDFDLSEKSSENNNN